MPRLLAPPSAETGYLATIEWWKDQIQRTLLVAHVVPALLGFVACAQLELGAGGRRIDTAAWGLVTVWTLFLLVAGWQRVANTRSLVVWVLADAAVMSAMHLIGTATRNVVNYAAIDGALFATVFVSTPVAFLQVAVADAGLVPVPYARRAGWTLPTPLVGWITPLVVTIAAVLTFRFVRVAIDALSRAAAGQERTDARRHEVVAAAAAAEATLRGLGEIEEALAPAVERLHGLAADYRRAVGASVRGRREADWVVECVAVIEHDLTGLRTVVERVDEQSLEEAIDTGILGAVSARLLEIRPERRLTPDALGAVLPARAASLVTAFVRETVANASVHGRPPIEVRAESRPGALRVEVADGGDGFDPRRVVRGLGLVSVERLAADAGAVIEHAKGAAGHVVALSVPLIR